MLESGLLREHEDHYELTGPLPPLAIPATLHDSLMARLDRLATAKAVAQLGATLGRRVCLRAAAGRGAPGRAERCSRACVQLVEAELLYQRGVPPQATYLFKHALIQDAAYQSLLKSTRQQYHQRIAQVLAAQFPETVEPRSPNCWRITTRRRVSRPRPCPTGSRPGNAPSQRSAYVEARQHLTTGLEVLATVPETPARHQHELDLLTALALVLGATKGQAAPELEPVLTRAEALAQQVGEPSQRFAVLRALYSFHNVRAEHQSARAVAEQLLDLAQRQHDPAQLLDAHFALGVTLANVGAFAPARTHLEQGIALSDPQRHATPHAIPGAMRNYGVSCRAMVAWVLWGLGYPDQAVQRSQEALTMAHALAHPFRLVEALRYECATPCPPPGVADGPGARRGRAGPGDRARVCALCGDGTFLRGWALAAQGQGAEGIAQMRQGLAAVRATGTAVSMPRYLAWLAEAYGQVGQVDEGLHLLAEALAVVDTTGERFYEAELHRLHGELLLRQAVPDAPAGRSLLPAGPRRGPPPAGQVLGAARRHEPEPAVAAPGQARRGP